LGLIIAGNVFGMLGQVVGTTLTLKPQPRSYSCSSQSVFHRESVEQWWSKIETQNYWYRVKK